MTFRNATPELLKNFRLSKDLSQARFAKKIGVSQATVSKAERFIDSINMGYLVKINEAFPVTKVREIKKNTFYPPKVSKPSFLRLCKLRFKYH